MKKILFILTSIIFYTNIFSFSESSISSSSDLISHSSTESESLMESASDDDTPTITKEEIAQELALHNSEPRFFINNPDLFKPDELNKKLIKKVIKDTSLYISKPTIINEIHKSKHTKLLTKYVKKQISSLDKTFFAGHIIYLNKKIFFHVCNILKTTHRTSKLIPKLYIKLISSLKYRFIKYDSWNNQMLNLSYLPNQEYPNKFYIVIINYILNFSDQSVETVFKICVDYLFKKNIKTDRIDIIFNGIIKKYKSKNTENIIKLKLKLKKYFASNKKKSSKPKKIENILEDSFEYQTCCICYEATEKLIPMSTLGHNHPENLCKECYIKLKDEKTITHDDGTSQKLNNTKCPLCRDPFKEKEKKK